jgi:hypothetical protein
LPTSADYAQVASLPVSETRTDGVEELVNCVARHQVGRGLPAGGEVSALAQGDHLFHVRPHGFGLRDCGFDALFDDERSHQVSQQGAAMAGVAA